VDIRGVYKNDIKFLSLNKCTVTKRERPDFLTTCELLLFQSVIGLWWVYLIGILDIGICQAIKILLFVEQTISFAWCT